MAKETQGANLPKQGTLSEPIDVPCLEIAQGKQKLYLFTLPASTLWSFLSINRREPNKDEGYQRVLSVSRVEALRRYIKDGHTMPVGLVVSLSGASYNSKKQSLHIPKGSDVGWVIDGQHRLAGAHKAVTDGADIDLPVIAFLDLDEESQIRQFVTINREGKGVSTSLVLDLLKHLPDKDPADLAKERANDIANELRKDEESVFYDRIAVVTAPRAGQISNTNFVRKVAPIVNSAKGILKIYELPLQKQIIENYFSATRKVFGEEWHKANSIFFQTVGFGAIMNAFEVVFQETLSRTGGFQIPAVVELLSPISHFDFSQWRNYGTGNKAETDAARDLLTDFKNALPKGNDPKARPIKL